ncbi:hypothetical protein V8C44DRAFT_317213 [Trichoderma aethiopicum]
MILSVLQPKRRVIPFAIVTTALKVLISAQVTSQLPSLASPIGHHQPPFSHLHVICTRTESKNSRIMSDRPRSTNDTCPCSPRVL